MTDRHWQLRDELYRLLHNWPALVVFFLAGAAAGWLTGYIWPSYFKGTREVYVALNPYRTYSDARFLALAKPRYSNIDNYHYWQMYQLETAIYRDTVVEETLQKLRQEDPYWNAVDGPQLRQMLDADWRTAGAWKLTASHPERRWARQAVQAWSDTAAASVTAAIKAARQTLAIDRQLAQANQAHLNTALRLQALQAAAGELQTWQVEAQKLPANDPLPPGMRWRAYSLTTAYAQTDPAWQSLLAELPAPNASAADYRLWVEKAAGRIAAELAVLPETVVTLKTAVTDLEAAYESSADAGLALSPNLQIENFGEISVAAVRPNSLLALIGGFIGLLTALLKGLMRIAKTEAAHG